MDPMLRTILLRDNSWLSRPESLQPWLASHLPDPLIPRLVVADNSESWQRCNRAHLVVGPRQAGKSTTIWAHLAEVARPVLFIDCEQALVQRWCQSAPVFLGELEEVVDTPVTLFFEEAQHLENAGLFFKGLVDRKLGVPLLVTGSSSFHLGARVRESLAGRASRSRLFPFALSELLGGLADMALVARDHEANMRWGRHVTVGGYPEVWLGADPGLTLGELVEAVVLRDASDRYRIARPDVFRRLLYLAAGEVGQLVNLSEWASILGVSRDTVGAYLEILEGGHLLVQVRPFAGGRRSEMTRTPKLFFVDDGIRNYLVGDLRPLNGRADAGALLENWVFSELWKALPADASLHFWRSTSKAEVDFVIRAGDTVVGIEVKAGRLGRTKLPRGARSFIEAYRPTAFLMVNRGVEANDRLGTTELHWLQPQHLVNAVADALAGTHFPGSLFLRERSI